MAQQARADGDAAAQAPRRLRARLARLGFGLGARLPYGLAYRLGGALGALAYRFPGRTRDVTDVNLGLCFPELSARERRRLGARATAHAGRMAFELGGVWSWPRERVESLVLAVEGWEHLEQAWSRGRGALLLTPHLGSWELAGLYVSSRTAMTSLYKPPRARELESVYTTSRARFGARLVPAGPSGVSAIVRALRGNETVGVLPDQDPGHGSGAFVPFFGVLANTSVLVPRLAQRTGARTLLVSCLREPAGRGFRLRIRPASAGLADPDLERATAAMNADIEALVREAPEQYLWSYKRFRFRPAGEPDPYRASAQARGDGAASR